MKKYLLISLFLCFLASYGQELTFKSVRPKAKKKDSITYTALDYKIISLVRDTTSIDTTLTIRNEYKHNPIGRDMFEYMPFSNMGQTYSSLAYDFRQTSIHTEMGATANNFYYLKTKEIPYYYLPTPITQFMYRSGIEQGQVLHSLFSANINPSLNVFVRYNALRSLGNYQNILSSIGNFVLGFSFSSKDKKYWLFSHYTFQDISRQENGGISVPEQFDSGDSQFSNRGVVDVAMTDAESLWEAKRYFLHHQYSFLKKQDNSSGTDIQLKHQFEYESKDYQYLQSALAPNNYLGEAYTPINLKDRTQLKTLTNTIGAELELPYLGKTFVFGKSYFYNYFFRGILINSGKKIPNTIRDNDYGIGLNWSKNYKGFSIDIEAEQMLVGTLLGTQFSGKMGYKFDDKNSILAGIKLRSAMPNFNKLLHQSDYKNYNWYYVGDFSRENYQTIFADVKTQWGEASLDISNINNYTYFSVNESGNKREQSQPSQYTGNIQYMKMKLSKDLQLGKFGLDNTLMYQKVIQNQDIINTPSFVTRNTLYFSTYLFQKAMYLQTGITMKYFSKYYADRYNPLLAEFEVQNQEKIGNYPYFDFFINAKVRTMRIFFKVEHFRSVGQHYYVAPLQPYRDMSIRLGISWNFFS